MLGNTTYMKNLIIILSITIILQGCVFAGSYTYADYYQTNMPTDTLINRIKIFKEKKPQFKIMVDSVETTDRIVILILTTQAFI